MSWAPDEVSSVAWGSGTRTTASALGCGMRSVLMGQLSHAIVRPCGVGWQVADGWIFCRRGLVGCFYRRSSRWQAAAVELLVIGAHR